METIAIIEDDTGLNRGIALALSQENFQFEHYFTIKDAEEGMGEHWRLVILDINLPDGSGLDLLKLIRQKTQAYVIILTANDLETDIVTGLEAGADDYVAKPFSLMILRARVHAGLRLKKSGLPAVTMDDFLFDFDKMEFFKANQPIELSKNEQKLLRILVENRGQTLRRETLIDRVWSDSGEFVDENALYVAVKRLRSKLEENPSKPKYLKSIYGIGYTWER